MKANKKQSLKTETSELKKEGKKLLEFTASPAEVVFSTGTITLATLSGIALYKNKKSFAPLLGSAIISLVLWGASCYAAKKINKAA